MRNLKHFPGALVLLLLVSLLGGAAFFLHNSSADASQNTPAVSTDTPTYALATDTALPTATSRPTATATSRSFPTNTPKPPTATRTPTPAVISLSTYSINSGTCASQTGMPETLTNTGGSTLNWTATVTSGTATVTPPPNGALAPNGSIQLMVTVTASGVLQFSAPGASNTPQNVTLICTPP